MYQGYSTKAINLFDYLFLEAQVIEKIYILCRLPSLFGKPFKHGILQIGVIPTYVYP
jgi:hypothetical protein